MAEVVDYIQSEDINYKPLISRAVIKTEAGDSELKKTAYDDIELSNSIGANNLTKIRQNLEQNGVFKVNKKNRKVDKKTNEWPTFPDTPDDSDYDQEDYRRHSEDDNDDE